MTEYPDGDKPARIFTAYRCGLCGQMVHVWHSKGETLRDVWRLHRTSCRARVQNGDGGQFCRHLGPSTEDSAKCGGCGGGLRTLFECSLHGRCLPFVSASLARRAPQDVHCCSVCDDYDAVALGHTPMAKTAAARMANEKIADPVVEERVRRERMLGRIQS